MSTATIGALPQYGPVVTTSKHETTFDSSLVRLKKVVYKQRIRLINFLRDFDGLRKGEMHPSQFTRAMSIAGLDKYLSTQEIQLICEHYTERRGSLEVMRYADLLAEVDAIFIMKGLEKNPLAEPANEPSELINRNRFEHGDKTLSPEKEAALASVTQRVAEACSKRGIVLKMLIDDAAKYFKGPKLYGHVTVAQFQQVMNVKVGIPVSPAEAMLVAEKYDNDDYPEFINYAAFGHVVNSMYD